jgi:hypothetical protein
MGSQFEQFEIRRLGPDLDTLKPGLEGPDTRYPHIGYIKRDDRAMAPLA